MLEVAVVILAYGPDPSGVIPLFKAVVAEGVAAHNVVVVNNPSAHGTLPESALPCDVVRFRSNGGYAPAMNQGLKWAAARGFAKALLLTNDVELDDGSIRALLDWSREHPRAALVGPLLRHRSSGEMFSAGGFLTDKGEHGHLPAGADPVEGAIRWVDGAVLLASVEVVQAVGGFDESFFMYWEEVDLAMRLQQSGWHVEVCPVASAAQRSGLNSRGPAGGYLTARNGLVCHWRNGGTRAVVRAAIGILRQVLGELRSGWPSGGRWVALARLWGILAFLARRVGPPPRLLTTRSDIDVVRKPQGFRRIAYWFPNAVGPSGDYNDSRQWNLMKEVSNLTPVVFLTQDYRRWLGRQPLLPRLERVSPNLTIVHGAFRYRSSERKNLPIVRAALDMIALKLAMPSLRFRSSLFWLSAPDPRYLVGRVGGIVYDCIDPPFDAEKKQLHDEAEAAVLEKADAVFCTASALLQATRHVHVPASLLPNACKSSSVHVTAPTRRARIGYLGVIDQRVCLDFLRLVCKVAPDVQIALRGRVLEIVKEEVAALLLDFPNLSVYDGQLTKFEGDAFMSSLSVGLIPYKTGPMGDAINPVKMYEYLARGIPVLGTEIAECIAHRPLVTTAAASEASVRIAVAQLLRERQDPGASRSRVAFAAANTWEVRAGNAVQALIGLGLLKP